MKRLGIIGYGNFTSFWAPYFEKDFDEILFYSRKNFENELKKDSKIKQSSFEKVCECEYIMIGVLIQYFEKTLIKMIPHLKKNSVLFDVCSLKKMPEEIMKKLIPKEIDIIATHPLFGPQSGKNGIEGFNIMIAPIRVEASKLNFLKEIFEKSMKLNIINISCEEHDKQMAYVQGLTHFIARGIKEIGGLNKDTIAKTKAYEALLNLEENISLDSWGLFESIENYNPYSKKIIEKFIKGIENLNQELSKNQK